MRKMVAHSGNEVLVRIMSIVRRVQLRFLQGIEQEKRQLQMVMSSLRRSDPKPSGKLLRLHLMRVPLA